MRSLAARPASARPWPILLLLPFLLGVRGPVPSRAPQEFEFTRLNRTYRDVARGAAPVERGLLRIDLSSPHQDVALSRHRLRLAPRGDGTHDADLLVRFQGRGRLDARVSVGGLGESFQDDLVLPDQTSRLIGRVRIERAPGEYRITTLSLPRDARVQIRSRAAGDLVGWCERMASIPFSPVECRGLDRALASAAVPLPAVGQTYRLIDEDLTTDERRQLDAYLGLAGKR